MLTWYVSTIHEYLGVWACAFAPTQRVYPLRHDPHFLNSARAVRDGSVDEGTAFAFLQTPLEAA